MSTFSGVSQVCHVEVGGNITLQSLSFSFAPSIAHSFAEQAVFTAEFGICWPVIDRETSQLFLAYFNISILKHYKTTVGLTWHESKNTFEAEYEQILLHSPSA